MLIRAGLLIDGAGNPPQQGRYINVENGRIAAVGWQDDFSREQVDQAVDYSLYTVLPGLIDTHVHLFLEGEADPRIREQRWKEAKEIQLLRAVKNLEMTIKRGVTTVRDLGGPHDIGLVLKDAVHKKILTGPDILTANQAISITGGHFYYAGGREADGPGEMAKAVREQVKAGADCIKLMLTGMVNFHTGSSGIEFSKAELQAAMGEARRLNRPVSVHVNGIAGVRLVLEAGVDTVEHGALLDSAAVELIAESQVYWGPTLIPFFKMQEYSKQHETAYLPADGVARVYEKHALMVKEGLAKGAKIIAGTDAGALDVEHGVVWQELALLTALGMPPMAAIAAATGEAAIAIGISDKTGIVAAGKNADMLVVHGNPADDMAVLANVVQVYKDGIGLFK